MGSFNFKQPPHFQQRTLKFIEEVSRTSLPVEQIKNKKKRSDEINQFDNKLRKVQGPLNFPLSCIGLVRARHPKTNKLIDGTCILISGNILLTCAHNLYSFQQKLFYSELEYYPGRNGPQSKKIRMKVNEHNVKIHPNFYQYQTSEHEYYDYAIIFLDENLENQYGFIEISHNYQANQSQVYLFGYPVEENNVKNEVYLYGSKGKITKNTQRILYYDMQTKSGQSGAPIMINDQGNWKIIGIHTVSDPSGIFINSEVAKTLNSWIKVNQSALTIKDGRQIFEDKEPRLQKMIKKYSWQNLVSLTFNRCNITTQNLLNLNKVSWRIRDFSLDFNKIDKICLEPSKFKQLQKLFLNINLIKVVDPCIYSFDRLTHIFLKENKIPKNSFQNISTFLMVSLQ